MFGGTKHTIAPTGARAVHVRTNKGTNAGKRFCTILLCVSADGQRLKTSIIFSGKGHVFKKEVDKYDKDVDVFFSPSSWSDAEQMREWARVTFRAGVDKSELNILFMDNFSAHKV
jgi:hypothetical protein